MTIYVSDVVAFLYYLLDKLPKNANKAFKKAEKGDASLYLPTIAAELYFLFEKKDWTKHWSILKDEMKRYASFNYYPFDRNVLDLFEETMAEEIHDKIIVSTTKLLKADALITKDEKLHELREVNTLW